MELPLYLVYIKNERIIDVNSTFDSLVKKAFEDYKRTDIVNKNIHEVFDFDKEYALMTISSYRIYIKYVIVNNIIALNCINTCVIDSRYFIHNTITPLTNVIELTKMLDTTSLKQKQKEYISIIKKNNFELTKNINDITNFLDYFSKGIKMYHESINLYVKLTNVLQLISNIYKTSVNVNTDKDIIIHDKKIMFDILYHLLFIFIKNSKENHMEISYENKKITFSSESLDKSYKDKLDSCIIHEYNYNDSLDFHIVKLLLKLTKSRIDYSEKTYTLTFV